MLNVQVNGQDRHYDHRDPRQSEQSRQDGAQESEQLGEQDVHHERQVIIHSVSVAGESVQYPPHGCHVKECELGLEIKE